MKYNFLTQTLLLVLSLVFISNVWAVKVSIHYEGEVTKVDDPLKSQFAVGDKITGDLTYLRLDWQEIYAYQIPGYSADEYREYSAADGIQDMSSSYNREGNVIYETSATSGSVEQIIVDALVSSYVSSADSGRSVGDYNLIRSSVSTGYYRDGNKLESRLVFSNGLSDTEVIGKLNDNSITTTYGAETKFIPDNKWIQMGLNSTPPEGSTVADIIGDDISAPYGEKWVVYSYQTDTNTYNKLNLTDIMLPGIGYWLIQATGNSLVIDMPDDSPPIETIKSPACPSEDRGCFEIPLATHSTDLQWQMIGIPFRIALRPSQYLRIITNDILSSCYAGCTLEEASEKDIIKLPIYSYDDRKSSYKNIKDFDYGNVPIGAAWIATLPAANGQNPKLLIF